MEQEKEKVVNKKPINKIIILIIAVLVVAAIGIVYGLGTGKILKPADKILLATYNTYDESVGIHKEFAKLKDFDQNKVGLTYTGEIEAQGQIFNYDFALNQDLSAKKLQTKFDLATGDFEIPTIYLNMDEEKLSAFAPDLLDVKFTYNYVNKDVSEYVQNILDAASGEGIPANVLDLVDSSIASYWSMIKDSEVLKKEMVEVLKNEFATIEIKEIADKKSFSHEDYSIETQGYTFTITSENIKNIINAIDEVYAKYVNIEEMRTMFEGMGMSAFEIEQALNPYGAMANSAELQNMKDIVVSTYIADNDLVAINLTSDESEFELQFLGKEIKANVINMIADEKIATLLTSVEGDEIKTNIESTEGTIVFTYNTNTGDFDMSNEEFGRGISGNLKVSSNDLTFVLDEVRDPELENTNMKFNMTLNNNPNFEDEPEMTVYEVKKLTETQVQSIQMMVFSIMMQLAY